MDLDGFPQRLKFTRITGTLCQSNVLRSRCTLSTRTIAAQWLLFIHILPGNETKQTANSSCLGKACDTRLSQWIVALRQMPFVARKCSFCANATA
jgi:hypothetical protein